MFRRYGRLSARPTAGEHSTGLGLSIVKRLVETMNGRVIVKSKAGESACITVTLPAALTSGKSMTFACPPEQSAGAKPQ